MHILSTTRAMQTLYTERFSLVASVCRTCASIQKLDTTKPREQKKISTENPLTPYRVHTLAGGAARLTEYAKQTGLNKIFRQIIPMAHKICYAVTGFNFIREVNIIDV